VKITTQIFDQDVLADWSNRTSWLVVERIGNWESDERRGFKETGFPERYARRVSEFREGDLIYTYVASGRSCIADIRVVCSEKAARALSLEWDDLFPIRVKTKPIVVLAPNDWVDVRNLVRRLDLSRSTNDWRQCFRHALRQISKRDAKLLVQECLMAAKRRVGGTEGNSQLR